MLGSSCCILILLSKAIVVECMPGIFIVVKVN